MPEEVKGKRTRRPKVEIKVSPVDYDKLEIYADLIKSKPEKIVEDSIREYFDKEEVKAVFGKSEKLIKLRQARNKKQEELDEIDRQIEEEESLLK